MSERYIVASMIMSWQASIDISKAEYDSLIQAVAGLLHCTDVEEKFDGLLESYRELEVYILGEALQSVFSLMHDDISSQLLRSTTARKLSNFLSSERLYTSTIETHTAAIVNDKTGGDQIVAAMNRQFESSLNYRVMHALRNYAQHAALPVHAYSVGAAWTPDRTFMDHEFDPTVNVADLAADSKFKRKTLAEIINGPPTLQLKPMVREYVQCLSTVHREFRDTTNHAVERFGLAIDQVKQRIKTKFPDVPDVAFAVFEADAEGHKLGTETNLSNVLTNYLKFLRTKNRQLVNFTKRRITY